MLPSLLTSFYLAMLLNPIRCVVSWYALWRSMEGDTWHIPPPYFWFSIQRDWRTL
jgi:hypothetical protein